MQKNIFGEVSALVIEDDEDVRELLSEILSNMGIKAIFEVSTGKEALSFVEGHHASISVIICDWNMPEMTGVELFESLKKMNINLPFLMITGRNDATSVMKARSLGVRAYIAKPFSPENIERKLRALLHKTKIAV